MPIAPPEAEFLDEIQTKFLRVFLIDVHSHLYLQLCLEIYISSNSRILLRISSNSRNLLHISTVQLLYTVKEKGGKPDRKPYPFPYGLMSENSQDYAQKPQRNCTFKYGLKVLTDHSNWEARVALFDP